LLLRFRARSDALGSGDQLTAQEAIQELIHASGDPRDDADSVCLKHVLQTLLEAAADERSDLLITQQANAIEHVIALKMEINLIHHLTSLDREDRDGD
jgi:hypothetical protein